MNNRRKISLERRINSNLRLVPKLNIIKIKQSAKELEADIIILKNYSPRMPGSRAAKNSEKAFISEALLKNEATNGSKTATSMIFNPSSKIVSFKKS